MTENWIPLSECINICEKNWLRDARNEANQGAAEAQINYGRILLRGTSFIRADPEKGLKHLKKASRHNAEAAYTIGKEFLSGKRIRQDVYKAYFYLRIASLFRCRCGRMKEEYHSGRISHAHPCFPYIAKQTLVQETFPEDCENHFQNRFSEWRSREE